VCVWRHISLIQVKAEHTAPRASRLSQSLLSVLAPSSNSLLSVNFAVENTLTLFGYEPKKKKQTRHNEGITRWSPLEVLLEHGVGSGERENTESHRPTPPLWPGGKALPRWSMPRREDTAGIDQENCRSGACGGGVARDYLHIGAFFFSFSGLGGEYPLWSLGQHPLNHLKTFFLSFCHPFIFF